MNPRQILLILRARWLVAVAVFALVAAGVVAVARLVPKQYVAETALMVDIRSPDPIATIFLPPAMSSGSLGTQLDIIRSDRVARKVVRMLRLVESPAVRQAWQEATGGRGKLEDWMANLIQKGLSVTPSRDSNIITLAYRGTDPAFVASVANAYAEAYIEASVELKVEPARQYANWFSDQAKVLRENVERAQARLSEFQRKSGIVATDEAVDVEMTKLSDLSTRLSVAQAEARDAKTKHTTSSHALDTLPEVMASSVVSSLRTNVAGLESKLKEASANLGPNHPQYKRMELELAELRKRLDTEEKRVARSLSTTGVVGSARESELRAAIELQKRKILDMRKSRDEISVLLRDVDTAKRAYEAVMSRLNQTNLDSQANRTNVSVLTPAVEPIEPSFPKPMRQMVLIAIALGLALGFGAAYGVELLDRRVRSQEDLAEMLQFPVLGVVLSGSGGKRLAAPAALALPLPPR